MKISAIQKIKLLVPLLLVCTWLFRGGYTVRRWLYRWKIVRQLRLKTRVISVGNLSLGGAGKTPLVLYLAERLSAQGKTAVIVAKGYGRTTKDFEILTAGQDRKATDVGDEPLLYAKRLKSTPIVIYQKKYLAALQVEKQLHPDICLIDDGFQHWRLARDIDIVLVTPDDLAVSAHLLPLGNLREPLSALSRADIVILNVTGYCDWQDEMLMKFKVLAPRAVHLTCRYQVAGLVDVLSDCPVLPGSVNGKIGLAVAGIARPLTFQALLKEQSYRIADTILFPDHYHYSLSDVRRCIQKARAAKAEYLITTEKDAVKLYSLYHPGKLQLPLYALSIKFRLISAEELFWQKIEQLGK